MNVEFDVQLTAKDLYRFNMRQSYTTSQGPISIVIALIVFFMAGVTINKGAYGYGLLYIGIGILFLIYIPITLYLRSKQTIKNNQVLAGVLHYMVSEKGIEVTQDGEHGLLEWKMIYKMIATKRQVLIYSNRVNAYIIPKEQLGENYDMLVKLAKQQLESYRYHFPSAR
jgi:hypothetical protein